jgi:hypothetical protein
MVIEEDLVERLAQAIHERYLSWQMRRGVPMGADESMRPWRESGQQRRSGQEQLSDDKKEANRAQARHIAYKLSRVGCAVVPLAGEEPAFELRDDEVEMLAELEHERWMAEREAAGWDYHSVRDDRARRHDRLVAWSKLSEDERDKDRQAVQALPALLAAVGLQVVRVEPDRARTPTDQVRADPRDH